VTFNIGTTDYQFFDLRTFKAFSSIVTVSQQVGQKAKYVGLMIDNNAGNII